MGPSCTCVASCSYRCSYLSICDSHAPSCAWHARKRAQDLHQTWWLLGQSTAESQMACNMPNTGVFSLYRGTLSTLGFLCDRTSQINVDCIHPWVIPNFHDNTIKENCVASQAHRHMHSLMDPSCHPLNGYGDNYVNFNNRNLGEIIINHYRDRVYGVCAIYAQNA